MFKIPSHKRQIYFANALEKARRLYLHESLLATCAGVDQALLRSELARYVPPSGLQILLGTAIRDEEVFATPCVLNQAPRLMSYYRLLLGVSQKQFYASATGLQVFASMETANQMSEKALELLPDLCLSFNRAITELLDVIPNDQLRFDVSNLPLMALGVQIDGSWRNVIGANATKNVFNSLKAIVKATGHRFEETDSSIMTINDSGRKVEVKLSSDPDVAIVEHFDDQPVFKVAIEIKGGSDNANVHNRAGEAEKSHQKAFASGMQDFWTVIKLQDVDLSSLKRESPSTRQWLDLSEVVNMSGESWELLVRLVRSAMGI